MLAFSAYSENNAVDIFVVHVATGDITPLTTTVYNDIQPNWSPDGTELAFASERWGLPITVYSMVPDDPANEPQVIGEGVQPVWSPDGARIAYYAFVGGALRLAIAEPGVVTHYLEMPGLINAPLTWSPDASTLIVQADQGNGFDLYTVDVADGQIQPLAATPTYEGNAAWSPDSEWIAYVAGINTLDTVWVAQPDGRDARQVSQAQTRSWYPAWRPQ